MMRASRLNIPTIDSLSANAESTRLTTTGMAKPAAPSHPVLASYALDHMREVDRRTPADMKAEALRDAKARGQA